ncbi:MAG: M20/M25/M40 family metallo-hydrolase [Lysobacter sp.]|nr:M20/M25/M40 family metallo-hydrolase [Lysobacter sp.]
MKFSHPMLWLAPALLLAAALPPQAQAANQARHAAETAQVLPGQDPLAPVYIVTSSESFARGVKTLATKTAVRRNSLGKTLVIASMPTYRLEELSHYMHEEEGRCGGYFAFGSQVEAETFIRNDKSAQAVSTSFLADYSIDKQALVNPWMLQVQETNIRATISHLSSYQNRYFASSHGYNAAVWIRDTWLGIAAGRRDVTAELFTACTNCSTQPSVILTIRGFEFPDEIVVLGGHLDSIRQSNPPGTTAENMVAPGADDDASGIATLTEILRVAMANGYRPKRTIKFMGYAAEEVGLRGSKAIAQSFQAQGKNVVGVLQLDMTNWKSPSSTFDINMISDYSNAPLQQFTRNLFATYMTPRGFTMNETACGYACSDHASWTASGFPAVMYDEGPIFPSLHTTNDRLENMGGTANHSVPIAQLGVAFMVELGKVRAADSTVPSLPGRGNTRPADPAIPSLPGRGSPKRGN